MKNEKKKLCNKPVFATALLVSITTGQVGNYLSVMLKAFYLKIINVWLSKDIQHRSVSLSRGYDG